MPIETLHSLINRQSNIDKFLSNDAYAFKTRFLQTGTFRRRPFVLIKPRKSTIPCRIHSFPARVQNSGKLPCLRNGYAAAGIDVKIFQLSQFGHFVLCWRRCILPKCCLPKCSCSLFVISEWRNTRLWDAVCKAIIVLTLRTNQCFFLRQVKW